METPDWLRVTPGQFNLAEVDTKDTRGPDGERVKRKEAEALHAENIVELQQLQHLLWAEGKQKLLVVLQALDTGGKDGAIRKTFGALNPQGVRIHAFKRPTSYELGHDFLWRCHQHTPPGGCIQVFNRSHYEDVLVVRVHGLVPEDRWRRRYDHIRNFERLLADEGTMVLKFMLHISKDEQKERLQARLDDPESHWKFEMGDLKERAHWDDYQIAFQDALTETACDWAPWYVIPADRKWFRNYALSTILLRTLQSVPMQWPEPDPGLHDVVIE